MELVRVLVGLPGVLRLFENFSPILHWEPQLQPTLDALYDAGLIPEPVAYHSEYVNKKHWEEFMSM